MIEDPPAAATDLPRVVFRRREVHAAVRGAQAAGKRVGVVPTMGALHAGHMSLVAAACEACDFVVVTIFVNPAQFGPHEDLSRYPRTLAADLQLLAALSVDVVFAPPEEEMYAPGHETYVEVGPVAEPLEGILRPGHFRGVATVVLKLFQSVPADVAYFGRKDYQQTLVVERMVRDFDVPIEICVLPIVREADGLAMSSRNTYLTEDDRRRALSLSQGLALAAELFAAGERRSVVLRELVATHIQKVGRAEIDYVVVVRAGTVDEVETIDGPAAILVAARIGQTRLIDNWRLE